MKVISMKREGRKHSKKKNYYKEENHKDEEVCRKRVT